MVVYNRNSQFELNTLKLSGDAKTVIRFSFYLKNPEYCAFTHIRSLKSVFWKSNKKIARYIVYSEIRGNWYILKKSVQPEA